MTTIPDRVVYGGALRRDGDRWTFRGPRPHDGWHAHGTTSKRLHVLDGDRIVLADVDKQRWKAPDGSTVHDRPPQDISWSAFTLVSVFGSVWLWVSGAAGLHRVSWPTERPSTRTVQRWLRRLLPDALAWQVAIRAEVVERLAPCPLEEKFPTGLPPPGGVARWKQEPARISELGRGQSLLEKTAPLLSIPPSTLLVGARRRFSGSRHR